MAKIFIERHHGAYLITWLSGEKGHEPDILVQTDWDYPSFAGYLGWEPCCGETDGTVNCKTHGKTASEMISEARQFLDDACECVSEVDDSFLDYFQ